jgi:hypothetical protein
LTGVGEFALAEENGAGLHGGVFGAGGGKSILLRALMESAVGYQSLQQSWLFRCGLGVYDNLRCRRFFHFPGGKNQMTSS